MKKYVSILQTDSKPGTAKPLYSSSSSLNRTPSQVLEKVILSRKLNINQSLSSFQDTPTIMQPSSTKAKHSGFDFIPTPNYRTPRPSITVSALPFQGYHGRSSSQEDFPPETLNTIKYDMQQGNTLLSPKDSVVEVPTYFKIKSIKNVSKTFDKDMTIHSLYEGAREVSVELESIVSQKYQKKLEESMSKFQTKDFINIQSLRVSNVLKVLEKNFVEGQIKEPQLLQEIWKMVSIEITKIKTVYNEFLESFNNLTSKLKDKQKTLDSQDLIDGLKNLILYSECYRNIGSTRDPEHREKNLDDLKKAMHIYKLDLKYKSKTNRKTFEVYEHAEGHVKGLNKLLDTETEKVQSLLEENIRLVKQRDELLSRQAVLKNEIVTIMDRKETELRNKVKEGLPDFQRKVYEGQISEQDKQVKKLTADNEHLKATVRTLKEDLKKFNEKGSAFGGKHDKGTMVNFYSDAPQKVKSVFKFCMNFSQSPITITTGTKLPDVLALSIVSLVYSDKLMTDIVDDFEKRPRKALGPYLFEWLLTRFGIFTVGEEILKDFLFTMKNSKIPYERYKTFLSMIGMQEVIAVPKKGKNDPETSIDVKEIKKKTYMTAECVKILHKFIEQVNTLNSNADSPTLKLPMHDFGPFLPREDSTKAVVNMQIARQIMNNLFKEYGFSVSESEDALDELHIVQQQTFWQKMNVKATIDEFTKDDDTIKFDALIDYLLDLCIGRQAKVVEKLYIALHATTTSSNEANISFEEFCSAIGKIFPKKSQIWKSHIFTKLMDQPTAGQIGLHKLIPNMIGALYQEDQVRDFQPPKLKKESIAHSGSNAPKSPKKNSGSNTPKSPKTDKRWDETRYDQQFLMPDAVDENKAAFQYGTKGLNEMAYQHYDAVSSLIVLQEIFYLMEAPIKEAQEANEVLNFTYKTFLAEIKIFPKHFGYIANYKDIMIMKKKELVNLLEYLWGLLRTMLVQTFRDTIKSP